MTKYIFVTGGVVSGLGKGITAASLGRLLKARGYKVAAQKLDPYVNVDPGTMSPYQHGEVYVTEDGAETDLDLGHYERFIDEDLNKYSNLTTGKVYWNVLHKERRGEYLGQTVQVIPHITNEIKDFIYAVGKRTNADIVITEIGGTTGDIESQPFLEAIRQVGLEVGEENSLFIHVTLVPFLSGSEEHKTKPTQHSVKELQGMGVKPDIIVLRCDEPLETDIFKKIALFCNVRPDCVIENMTVPDLYEAPLMLEKSNFSNIVCRELALPQDEPDLTEWEGLVDRIKTLDVRAKAIRPEVDRVITWAKKGDLASRRLAIAKVGDKELVREVFEKAAQGMWADRNGGYTRIMKLGPRKGDAAEVVIIELVTEPVAGKQQASVTKVEEAADAE